MAAPSGSLGYKGRSFYNTGEIMSIDSIKYSMDVVAGSVALATLAQILPPLAAGMTIIWLSIQIGTWYYDRFINVKKIKKDE